MTQEADTRSLALSTDPHQRPALWKRVIAGLLMLTINVSAFAQAVSPVLGAGGRPYSGYTKDGTLVQGGQVVGNPHQSLHDLQNPALWTTAAVAFSNTTDPSFTQAILGDIESAIAVTPEAGGLALARLYLTPTNPYADANAGAAGCDAATTCNQAVYNQILLDAAASGYVATASGTHLGKTHDSSSAEIFNRGFNLYQEKPVFLAAQDPLGGATAFFALQGEQAKTHLQHLQTQNVSLLGGTIFFSQQTIKGPGNGSTSHWDGSTNDPGAAFDAALGSAPSVNASAGSGGFVVGYIQPDGQAHEFNLQRDSHFQDFQRQQGYGEWGGQGNTDSALGQNLRTAGLQNQKGQQAAAGIDFGYFQEDRSLFLQGLDLYKFGNRGDNGLLQQLQNGQIGPGHPDYERARALAEERFKLAYASQVEYNTKAHFTAEAAKYQADQLDLAAYDNGKLFKSGLNLYDKRGDPEQERLLKLLENGELKPDHPRYAEIRGLAEARYKVAYAKALEPPKKSSWLKTLAAVVIAAIVVYFTAGAATGWAAAAIPGATTSVTVGAVTTTTLATGTVAATAATAIGSAVGAYAGAVISAGIQTGSLSKALAAGENSFKGGVAGIIVNTAMAAAGVSAGGIGQGLGLTGDMAKHVGGAIYNTMTGSLSQSIAHGGSFGDALVSNAVSNITTAVSAIGANAIAGAKLDAFSTELAHAGLGCAAGMVRSGSSGGCAPGATGAVIAHLGAGYLDAATGRTLSDSELSFWSSTAGGVGAALVGGKDSVQTSFGLGQSTGQNAVDNNYLTTRALSGALENLKACTKGCEVLQKSLQNTMQTSVGGLQSLCKANPQGCLGTVQDMASALNELQKPETRALLGDAGTDALIARQTKDLGTAVESLQWGADHLESSQAIARAAVATGMTIAGGGVLVSLGRAVMAACGSGLATSACVGLSTELAVGAMETAGGVPTVGMTAASLTATANQLAKTAASATDAAQVVKELQLVRAEVAAGRSGATGVNGGVVEPVVTAKGTVNGAVFEDVNQTAKVGATNEPTLIADRVATKTEAQGKPFPNGTVADSHAEIGVIQQAYDAGKTQGAGMTMTVSGKDVCGYCKGDIAAAADAAGLKSLTVQAIDNVTGLPKTYYWQPGMKSIREKQ